MLFIKIPSPRTAIAIHASQMSIRSLLRERCTLVKPDGQRFSSILSGFQVDKITLIDDAKLPVEEGDVVERKLPNGLLEEYVILDRGFYPARGGFPAMYQAKVRKKTSLPSPVGGGQTVYNLIGPNSRVNIRSHDASQNVIAVTPSNLFADIRTAVEQGISDAQRREEVLSRVAELEKSLGTESFRDRYIQFMGTVADHVGLFGPFLPALAQLLA